MTCIHVADKNGYCKECGEQCTQFVKEELYFVSPGAFTKYDWVDKIIPGKIEIFLPRQQGVITNIGEREEMEIKNNTESKEQRFVNAGGILPNIVKQTVPKKPTASDQHFEKILLNCVKEFWHGKDRHVKIVEMNDKHLINTMKFLLTHARGIEEAFNYKWQNHATAGLPGAYVNACDAVWVMVKKSNNKVSKLYIMIPCFENLATEIVSRFGHRALMALYDGDGK